MQNNIRYLTRDAHVLRSLSVSFGNGHISHTLRDGWARDDVRVGEDTLYDLASVTKLFLLCVLMRLKEEGRLDIGRSVTEYEPRFTRLCGVSVETLMRFGVCLTTPVRIDGCAGREEGLAALFDCTPSPLQGARVYSDIPPMALKYVAEKCADRTLYEAIEHYVLRPLGMTHTFAAVPDASLCCDYSGERRMEAGKLTVREGPAPGTPHDPKAALLSPHGEDLCGHAGLFSTEGDMIRFCRGLLGGLLHPETIREIAVNRTGCPLPGGGYRQYLGYLTYLKHPCQYDSEIPPYMGERAFAMGGFTGNHLSVDPEKGIFTLFLGNRCYRRLSVARLRAGETLSDLGLAANGEGTYAGVYSSVDYVHRKDELLHAPIGRFWEELA